MTQKSPPPSMAQRIAETLPTLTRAHRKIADHVLVHPLKVATQPIDELATALEVSVATVNRFARALGFDGYPPFRAALVRDFENALAPVDKLRNQLETPATPADVFASSLNDIQRNIELTRNALDPTSCERAVDAILKAQKIRIVGFGASSWLGGLLQRGLDTHCDDVQLLANIEGSSFAARVMGRLKPTDLVIVIGFPRYSADTVYLAQRAAEIGVPVLALTDRVTSPLAQLALVSLYVHTDSAYFSNSETSALALVEALCSAVVHRCQGSLDGAAQLAESMLPWIHGNHANCLRPTAPVSAMPRSKSVVSKRGSGRKS